MNQRVVITGLGVVSPNGVGVSIFLEALQKGRSGIRHIPELEERNFGCHVGGIPEIDDELLSDYFSPLALRSLRASNIMYGCIAGRDAWKDAGLELRDKNESPDWDSGCIFGTGMSGAEIWHHCIYTVDAGKVKRLGSGVVDQGMASGISAFLGGMMGLGNQVSTNAAACSTGTEALLMAAERIRSGRAKRMLAGACEGYSPYTWGPFDSLRILSRIHKDEPERASRPMSATAKGFVPGAGAGALVVESLESALERGATIYAEILGGAGNSGGHRGGGSMTAPNPEGIRRCIAQAIQNAAIEANEIDLISGHLTATMGDPVEVANWSKVLDRKGKNFPYINSLKSMIGHCLSAAGAIESVASVLQLHHDFVHPSLNSEDVHPKIAEVIDADCIPQETILNAGIRTLAKASFGFGDVNACVVLRKWEG